jgi:hypothetical protein
LPVVQVEDIDNQVMETEEVVLVVLDIQLKLILHLLVRQVIL